MYNTLKTLCLTPGISGREGAIRDLLATQIAPFADEVYTDALGNLIAKQCGNGEDKKKIMLCAHMDEIGFLITFIEDSGMLRLAPVGGISWSAAA